MLIPFTRKWRERAEMRLALAEEARLKLQAGRKARCRAYAEHASAVLAPLNLMVTEFQDAGTQRSAFARCPTGGVLYRIDAEYDGWSISPV
jgi:hypothetical protein